MINPSKKSLQVYGLVAIDILLVAAAIFSSFYLMFGNAALSLRYWWFFPLSIAFYIGTFRNFGLYYWAWQYMSVREVMSLVKAVILSSLLLAGSLIAFGQRAFPFRVLLIEGLLCFAFIGGVRLLIRLWKEARSGAETEGAKKKVLIVGAGDAGEMILREILKLAQLKYQPVGFVDDNQQKKGTSIHSYPVLGGCERIPEIVSGQGVDEIIIAIPSANHKEIRRIVGFCEQTRAKFRIVPGIYELIDGTVHMNQIRDVEIEDLLGREPVKLDINNISSYLTDSRILITGAGGSIGSELCRQVALFNPSRLIILGKGENSIFDIELELRGRFPFLSLGVYIADVRDPERMDNIFRLEKPDVIFHAAAHKHVPLMERDPDEAVLNNIVGTNNLVETSHRHGAKKFVMISTDKAVNPSSVMGATKRVAEMIVQAKAVSGSATKFVAVRFGNVLGSRGSVIPLFKKQILAGGPVTVTHPEAKRYFMTIPEAVQLVIQAGSMGNGGEVFILNMGEPVKIVDLAKDLIRLSGLEAGTDIEIKFTGMRPGEKIFEELLTAEEGAKATRHEKIYVAAPLDQDAQKLGTDIKAIERLARSGDNDGIRAKLKEMIPAYKGARK